MPRNSSDMHMMNPETHHTFIYDEPRWRSSRTQQYFDVFSRTQNVHPYFQVKASGAHDTWHKTIGHSPMATRGQDTL